MHHNLRLRKYLPTLVLLFFVSTSNAQSSVSETDLSIIADRFKLSDLPKSVDQTEDKPKVDPASELRHWSLKGVVGTDTDRLALVQRGDQSKQLNIGDTLEGFTLSDMSAFSIVFTSDNANVTLSLPSTP